MSAVVYKLDSSHSRIGFSVRHLGISNVRGDFGTFEGTLTYDPESPESSHVEVTIDTASLRTGEAQRDGHLKSADFFDVEKYPTITFSSTRIEPTEPGEGKVTGDLTIHGVTREVTLDVEGPSPEITDPFGNIKFGIDVRGRINRSDFGLTWNAALETGGFLVGDKVEMTFETQFVRQK